MSKRLPVTVVTGFLGSGKTTLIRYLLRFGQQRLAVLVNEFGSIGLDGDLFKSCGFCPEEEVEGLIVELNNGCLCCTVQDDFLPTMEKLLSRADQLDGILIETSGLAFPKPLLKALMWPSIRTKVHVNGVVTVVNGEALQKGSPIGDISLIELQRNEDKSIDHLTPIDELFSNQLEVADLVLISRADCISASCVKQIEFDLSSKISSATSVCPIINGKIDPSIILGLEHKDSFSQTGDDVGSHEHHDHLKVISSTVRIEKNISKKKLEKILSEASIHYQIIRIKGRCWLSNKNLPLQVQMVGPRINTWFEEIPKSAWKPKNFGIDLVILSLKEGAAEAIKEGIDSC